jgi:mRNA interferase MazF
MTVLVCAVTSDLRRAKSPGNVLLSEGEAGLPKASVVNVTDTNAIDKKDLLEKIGTLSAERLEEVLAGVRFLIQPIHGGG